MRKNFITLLLLFVVKVGFSQTSGDFRTKITGEWVNPMTWETYNGTAWVNATTYPTYLNGEIRIRNGHVISYSDPNAIWEIYIDQVIVDVGGELLANYGNSGNFVLNNGTGADLIVNGKASIRYLSFYLTSSILINTTGEFVHKGIFPIVTNNGLVTFFDGYQNNFYGTFINNGTVNCFSAVSMQTEANIWFYNYGTINIKHQAGLYAYPTTTFTSTSTGGGLENSGTINIEQNCTFNPVIATFYNLSTGKIKLLNSTFTSGSIVQNQTTGGIFFNEGLIEGSGEVVQRNTFINQGKVKPQQALRYNYDIVANTLLGASSNLEMSITNDNGAGVGNDLLKTLSDITLRGSLTIVESGTVPTGIYTIIKAEVGDITGTFSTLNLPPGYTVLYNRKYVQVIKGSPPIGTNNYRTKNTGLWSVPANWERFNGSNWVTASTFPDNTNGEIRILSGHSMTLDNLYTTTFNRYTFDQVIINQGGVLTLANEQSFDNGVGTDLEINGTLNINAHLSSIGIGFDNPVPTINDGTTVLVNSTGVINLTTGNIRPNLTNNGTINLIGNAGNSYLYKPFINDGKINLNSTGYTFFGKDEFRNSSTGEIILNNNRGIAWQGFVLGITNVGPVFNNYGTIKGYGFLGSSFYASINNYGILSPGLTAGSISSLGFGSGTILPLSASSHVKIDILNAGGEGIGHDVFAKLGDIALNGQLTVTDPGNAPIGSYTIVKANSGIISGTFSSVSLPSGYNIQYNASTVVVNKTVCPACNCVLNTSLTTGNWSTATTWSCGHIPLATEPVQISSGHTITLDVNGAAKSLDLRGILNKQATKVLTIQGN
jgi:hypothetical protein